MEHTDLYKLNLKSLSQGTHEFVYTLTERYFSQIEESEILDGEVEVTVHLEKSGEVHKLELTYDGYALVTCDRCLSSVKLDVYEERDIVVKYGAEYAEEDDIIILPEREGVLDLQWMLYEDIVLSLPMQRMHEQGDCDSDMMSLYASMATDEVGTEDDADIERDEDGIDQRWAALKKLKKD